MVVGTTQSALALVVEPLPIALVEGNMIHRRCPTASFPAPKSDMYPEMARAPVSPSARLEFAAAARPEAEEHLQEVGGAWLRERLASIIKAARCALAESAASKRTLLS